MHFKYQHLYTTADTQ